MLLIIILSCVPLLYNSAYGKREALKRFVIEDAAKPAIFGSYSYDPVLQVFVPPPQDRQNGNDGDGGHGGHSVTPNGGGSSVTDPNKDRKKIVSGSTKQNQFRSNLRTKIPPKVSNRPNSPKNAGPLNKRFTKITKSVTTSQRPKLPLKKDATSKSVKSNKV